MSNVLKPDAMVLSQNQVTDTIGMDCSCPVCGGDVKAVSSEAICSLCERCFPLRDGVIDFRLARHDYHDNPVSREEMRRINERFRTRPWNDTLGDFLQLSEDAPRWLDEIKEEGRYAWKIFLSLRPGMVFLDLGCGLGTSTQNLAPHFARTYAVDLTYENAVFTRHRLNFFNSDDDISVVVGGDDSRLPLHDESIDVANASNVLEAVGEGDISEYARGGSFRRLWNGLRSPHGSRNPNSKQLAILREISRVLKRDGEVFIRCGNRLSYRQFTDDPNEKTGRSTMPLLPRVLANLISLVRTGKPARRYQHTIHGYRKLLRQSGFEQIEFVAFHQDDNLCEVIRPGPGQFPFWSPPPCSGWKQKIKQTAFFAPNFGILARKQIRRNPSLEESLVDYIVHELGLKREHVQTKHYLVSPKGKLIVRAMCGEQELYIRLPLNDQATGAERRNHTRLEWLKEHRRGMVGYFPNPILKGCVAGKEFFVESAVYGTPILNLLKKQRSASDSLRMGMDLLVDLAEPSTATQPHLDGQAYERLVSKPLQALATLISPDEMTRLQEFFKVRLEDRQLPRGLLHGDFSARNILAERGAVSGLLDWEESDTDGIPALDAICLTLSCYRRLGTETDRGDSLLDLARRRGYFGDYLKELDLYYRRTGTDESCHEGLVSLFWIQVMSHRVRLGRTVRNTSDERYVKHVVAQMLEL